MKRPENLKVGDRFRVIGDCATFTKDSIIELTVDDGTDMPFFNLIEGDFTPSLLCYISRELLNGTAAAAFTFLEPIVED